MIAATVGRGIASLFILLGVWQIFVGNLSNGLWIAFIGWFLESAANSQLTQQHLHGYWKATLLPRPWDATMRWSRLSFLTAIGG